MIEHIGHFLGHRVRIKTGHRNAAQRLDRGKGPVEGRGPVGPDEPPPCRPAPGPAGAGRAHKGANLVALLGPAPALADAVFLVALPLPGAIRKIAARSGPDTSETCRERSALAPNPLPPGGQKSARIRSGEAVDRLLCDYVSRVFHRKNRAAINSPLDRHGPALLGLLRALSIGPRTLPPNVRLRMSSAPRDRAR